MITFKTFLTEAPKDPWDISWKSETWNIILEQYQLYFPPSLVKKYITDREIVALHTTTISGLYKLRAIQHTRKTISTFTKVEGSYGISRLFTTFSGDYKEDQRSMDVLVKVQGKLVFPGQHDIGSVPDEKGVRGFSIYDFPLLRKFRNKVDKMCIDLYNELYGSNYETMAKLRYNISFLNFNNKNFRKFKLLLIQKYFQMFKQFLQEKGVEIFDTHYRGHDKKEIQHYNEYLVSNFSIKEVLIICDVKEREDAVTEFIHKTPQLKFVNKDSWIEIINKDIDRSAIREELYPQIRKFIQLEGTT